MYTYSVSEKAQVWRELFFSETLGWYIISQDEGEKFVKKNKNVLDAKSSVKSPISAQRVIKLDSA